MNISIYTATEINNTKIIHLSSMFYVLCSKFSTHSVLYCSISTWCYMGLLKRKGHTH